MPRRQPATFSRSRELSQVYFLPRLLSNSTSVVPCCYPRCFSSVFFPFPSSCLSRVSFIVSTHTHTISPSLYSRCIFETFPRARTSGAWPPNPPALPLGPRSRSRLRVCVRAEKNEAEGWKRDTRITGCLATPAEDIRRASRPPGEIYASAEIVERDAQLS